MKSLTTLADPLATSSPTGNGNEAASTGPPPSAPHKKFTHVALFLLSPFLGWIYAPLMLAGYVTGMGFSEVSSYHLGKDRLYGAVVLIVFFAIAPLAVVFVLLDWSSDPSEVVQAFHRYAPLGTMLVVLVWMAMMLWRYRVLTESRHTANIRQRLSTYKIHPIRIRGPNNVVTTYENASDLYNYIQCETRHMWTLFLVIIATTAQAVLVKSLDTDYNVMWWLSLIFWIGIFFVFDSVCVGVIMRYDNTRIVLEKFNTLTTKSSEKEKKSDEVVPSQVPYLNISERLAPSRNMEKDLGDVASALTMMGPGSLGATTTSGGVVPCDNFEAWLRLREALVLEISQPETVMQTLFLPTCLLVMLGLFVSITYVVLRIFLMNTGIGSVAYSQIFVLVTTSVFTFAIFTVANKIQKLFDYQMRSIAGLEFEISKLITQVERNALADIVPDPKNTNKLEELKAFYRLVFAANTYLHSCPARPVVLGLAMRSWVWVGLFIGVVTLNALFVVASIEDPNRASYKKSANGTATLPSVC
jgi:hypothetical protein